ncbi:MAG: YlbF family regulator [Lachnospiraceae bacterium]|nr:YlbF family regulator [Lachnospiraceae bacterium]MBR3761640.1 YlbF family regulator [Lachnospiraceae bacterium]
MREVTEILNETNVLINTIKGTSVYTEFRSALEDLQKYPELKAQADAFRAENYLAYHALKGPVSFADFNSLEDKRTELAKYPQIDRYLKAEVALCRVLQEVQGRLTAAMGFD